MILRQWLVCAPLALWLIGCDDSDAQSQDIPNALAQHADAELQRNGSMPQGRIQGNPADYPGVDVYYPDYDNSLKYNPENKTVLDPSTGQKFWVKSPHGDGVGHFGVISADNKEIVQGGYYSHWVTLAGNRRALIIDLASTYTTSPGIRGIHPTLFGAGELVEFFRVQADGGSPRESRRFIVVDSRHVRSLARQ